MSVNQSKLLKNTEGCRTCAACCKVFTFYDNNEGGFVDRIRLLNTDKIKVEETDFVDDNKRRLFRIIIDIPCSALEEKDNKYYCKLYGKKERPEMCNDYPFEITDWEEKYCKGINS